MLRKFFNSVASKLFMLCMIPVIVFMLLIFFYIIPNSKENILEAKKMQVKNMVQSTMNMIDYYYSLEKSGAMKRNDAQKAAIAAIRSMKFGDNGKDYYWINDMNCVMIAHPFRSDLEGKELSGFSDPDGFKIFVGFVDKVKKEGKGYVPYRWQYYDDKNRVAQKMSYVEGFQPWGWVVGTGIYLDDINDAKVASETRILLLWLILAVVVVLAAGYFVIKRNILCPLGNVTGVMSKVEKGDLTARVKVHSHDEFGQLANSFDALLEVLQGMIRKIFVASDAVKQSASALMQSSNTMAANSEEVNAKTGVVSAAVEEMTASIQGSAMASSEASVNISTIAAAITEMTATVGSMATAAEETSSGVGQVIQAIDRNAGNIQNITNSSAEVANSVNSVATAIKEINISLNEVSKNCERSITITVNAENRAKETTEIIDRLNGLSKQVGKVVGVINDIADQTNMLALNAAIEAAGAGEAGKGFAVVANEVKELARQTAEATDEIATQIDAMQSNMLGAVNSVAEIAEVIGEITNITSAIAAAVTQQSATTGDISKAVVQAAGRVSDITNEIEAVSLGQNDVVRSAKDAGSGVNDVARSAAELSVGSREIAKNSEIATVKVNEIALSAKELSQGAEDIAKSMQDISTATGDTADNAGLTSNAAVELAETAEQLEMLIKQFKI